MWVRAWVSTPMTNGQVCATVVMTVEGSFLTNGQMLLASVRPASARVMVTPRHSCDGPQPPTGSTRRMDDLVRTLGITGLSSLRCPIWPKTSTSR